MSLFEDPVDDGGTEHECTETVLVSYSSKEDNELLVGNHTNDSIVESMDELFSAAEILVLLLQQTSK